MLKLKHISLDIKILSLLIYEFLVVIGVMLIVFQNQKVINRMTNVFD